VLELRYFCFSRKTLALQQLAQPTHGREPSNTPWEKDPQMSFLPLAVVPGEVTLGGQHPPWAWDKQVW